MMYLICYVLLFYKICMPLLHIQIGLQNGSFLTENTQSYEVMEFVLHNLIQLTDPKKNSD